MNHFDVAYRNSSAYKKEPERQLRDVASSVAVGFAAKYLFETPYAFLISYVISADQSVDLIEKWMVKKRKIRSWAQWYQFEVAFFLLLLQMIKISDRFLFPERRSNIVKVTLVIYLIKRAAAAWELHQMRKFF